MALDLLSIINALMEERNRVDRIIRSLESAAYPVRKGRRKGKPESSKAGKKRSGPGRKSMDEAERQVVAERMKRYWAGRRAVQDPPPDPAAKGSGPKGEA